jgi:hypothetical protein
MDQLPSIRRLANGAIDYDFYRRKARAERLAAIADFFFTPKKRSSRVATVTLLARLRAAWKS